MAGERRGFWVVGSECIEDAFCCLTGAAVRRGEEVEGIGWTEEGTQFYACFFGLQWICQLGLLGYEPAWNTCFQPSGVSLTRWSGTVW